MQWSSKFSVNVDYLDRQHLRIVEYITAAEAMLQKQQSGELIHLSELKKLITQLVAYTTEHFTDEEKILTRHKVPGLARHIELHRNLISQLGVLSAKVDQHGAQILPILVKFLVEWLQSHILGVDMGYAKLIGKREIP